MDITYLFLIFIIFLTFGSCTYRPVVMLHGILGDKSDMILPKQWIEKDYPGIYVANIEIGNGFYDRFRMIYLLNLKN